MNALMPWADGVEEMEAVIVTDVLRRAEWDVVTAGLGSGPVTASRGVRLLPDTTWAAARSEPFDMLIIPGGAEGVRRLCDDASVIETVRQADHQNRWLAAICAGPLVFERAGILSGRRVTAYPSVTAWLSSATVLDDPVVCDGRLVTSRGPGTAIQFALRLVACEDPARAAAVAEAMVCDPTCC